MSAWAPRYRVVTVGSARVRVATSGEGPPLLMLNGIGANIELWEPLASRLPARRLVMLDLPGAGESPPLTVPLRLPGYARLVVRVLDQLGLECVDVLGYSWGGALAQELARRHPVRVRSLVLAAAVPGVGGQPPAPWVVALTATPVRYWSPTYLRLVAPVALGSSPTLTDDASGPAQRRRPPTARGYAQQLYAITGWSSRPWLRRLRVPTLVLSGSRDPLVPARNARILARDIPGAELHVVPGGHLFLLEQPAEAAAAIDAFLRRQDDATDRQPAGVRPRT